MLFKKKVTKKYKNKPFTNFITSKVQINLNQRSYQHQHKTFKLKEKKMTI